MHVMVLGAGLLGVTSAYFLRQQGHDVTVVDRQATPAAETSYANGGQISVSHAEPWANPSAPLKVLKWLAHEDAPLLFRLRADLRQWLWMAAFLRECTPARTRRNIEHIVRLGTYSREMLQQLRARHRPRLRPADERHSALLHERRRAARGRRPGRADARARLRPPLDHRRRSRADRACARAHQAETRGRDLHDPRRVRRRESFRARARRALPGGRRPLSDEPHDHGVARVGRQAGARRGHGFRRPLPVPAGRRVRAGAWQLEPVVRTGARDSACRSIPRRATR